MADISITDQVNLIASVEVSDDSPLARANLKSLKFSSVPVVSDFPKPIDQFPLADVELGMGLNSPAALIGNDLQFTLGVSESASFSVCPSKREKLFDDEFSPAIQIKPGECWAGLCIKFTVKETVGTPASGFGLTIGAGEAVSLGAYIRFPQSGSSLPTFKDGLVAMLQSYSVPATPEKIRATPIGTAHTAETSGSISVGAFYSLPLTVNPLATLGMPLNLSLNIAPGVEACLNGTVTLKGSFIVRTYRSSDTKLVFGVYKKRETSLTASLTTSAGIGVDVNKTDVLAKVLNVVVPSADLDDLHLDESQKKDLSSALKDCVDQSISIAMNACFAKSDSDEAAVVYELDLSGGDMTRTDAAIASALRGDWSQFETLPSARPIRNIVRVSQDRKYKLTLNLLGLYNATSISDYLRSTTVLHDEHGQISIVDKAAATKLSAGVTPYAAKSDKLRAALAQAFVATIAYGAAKGKLGVLTFTVQQSFLEYHAKATASNLTPQILLARAVKLPLNDDWDSILKFKGQFDQNKFCLDIGYDIRSVLRLFFQDVDSRKPYPADVLDRTGRDTRIALLDPLAPNSMQRRLALSSDEIWKAMSDSGNPANFNLIPGLAKLSDPALADISADFLDIRWWSNALQSLTPKLAAVLHAIDQSKSPDPLTDATFMTAHKALENALASLTSKTHSAFGDGWPLAVMYRLAASSQSVAGPSVQMDIGWDGKFEHYETGAKIAVGQSTGA